MNNRLLSINEAAHILGISKHTLNGWVSKRQISFVKVGRRTLFDTAVVDPETQARFYEMLAALNQQKGLTIVLITHDIGVISKHVNKVACLNQRLFFQGTHEDFCNSSTVQEILKGEHHLVCHRH